MDSVNANDCNGRIIICVRSPSTNHVFVKLTLKMLELCSDHYRNSSHSDINQSNNFISCHQTKIIISISIAIHLFNPLTRIYVAENQRTRTYPDLALIMLVNWHHSQIQFHHMLRTYRPLCYKGLLAL